MSERGRYRRGRGRVVQRIVGMVIVLLAALLLISVVTNMLPAPVESITLELPPTPPPATSDAVAVLNPTVTLIPATSTPAPTATLRPTAVPSVTPTPAATATPEPSPSAPPTAASVAPTTPPAAQPPVAAVGFVAQVNRSFSNANSGQTNSCVLAHVVNSDGSGIGGALLNADNGASTTANAVTNGSGYAEICGLGASRWSVRLWAVPIGPLPDAPVQAVFDVSGRKEDYALVTFVRSR